jgi:hypothetical protein
MIILNILSLIYGYGLILLGIFMVIFLLSHLSLD